MQKILPLLGLLIVVGCKDSKITVEHSGIPAAQASGRYQMVVNQPHFNNPYGRDNSSTRVFLIDTERGRVWGYSPAQEDSGLRFVEHFHEIDVTDKEGILGMTYLEWYKQMTEINEERLRRKREKEAGAE